MPDALGRAVSFISDPRLPLYYPLNRLRWDSLRSRMDRLDLGQNPELDLIFTVDVEYDYGSGGKGEAGCASPFLKLAKGFFDKHGIKATLFVQGDLIQRLAGDIRALGASHEIGLHGYAHEQWGQSWFVKDPVPSPKERKELISKSLAAFKAAGFQAPSSFRAPNMVIDPLSLGILKEAGFTADSSYPSYSGGGNAAALSHGLAEVPVSFDPKPVFGHSLRARYVVFNTHNIVKKELDIVAAATRVAKAQILADQKPHVMLLCHPWEFFEPEMGPGDPSFGYSSPKNLSLLEDALESLKGSFRVRPKTLSDFVRSDFISASQR
ncbi:MAG: polysaccharide deacetylase family protein [Candidatus Micrarchaeota archaeon]